MKKPEFLKGHEEKRRDEKADAMETEEDHSLQAQAKERAKHPEHLNAGTPYEWEDVEAYQKELDRLDREGPGGSSEGTPKNATPKNS